MSGHSRLGSSGRCRRPGGWAPILIPILVLAPLIPWPLAADPLLEQRVARIERMLDQEGASALLLQIQRLQQEVRELRGLVETQQFELERQQRQQRDQYLDLDQRLGSRPAAESFTESPTPLTDPRQALASGADDRRLPWPEPSLGMRGAIDAGGIPRPPGDDWPATQPTPTTGQRVPSLPPPETTFSGNEREDYAAAFDLLKERHYAEAATAFTAFVTRYPGGELTPNALYWLAETHYAQRDLAASLADFERLASQYPDHAKTPGALLKIGYIHDEQGAAGEARGALQRVIERFPQSTEARLARDRLERLGSEGR